MGSLTKGTIALSLLMSGVLAHPAAAHPTPLRVQTHDGLSFTLPPGYRPSPELVQPAGLFEAAFTEEAAEPGGPSIQLFIVRAPELATHEVFSLDARGARAPAGALVA